LRQILVKHGKAAESVDLTRTEIASDNGGYQAKLQGTAFSKIYFGGLRVTTAKWIVSVCPFIG
jgi:hypothetical protein